MSRPCTEAGFLGDVAKHELTILRDDGLNRHVRLKGPGTYNCYFDLITWPGKLCISGDMGTYVFARLPDMFEFFRTDRDHGPSPKEGETLFINLGYWAEKLLAVDKNGRVKEFDRERAERVVREYLDDDLKEALGEKRFAALVEEVESRVLAHLDDGEYDFRAAVRDFDFIESKREIFPDFWERDLREYTYSFVWSCYAIAWGIMKYDEAKKGGGDAGTIQA